MITWDAKVAAVMGQTKKPQADGLAKLGIATVGDLLRHYPRSFIKKGSLDNPGSMEVGNQLTVLGTVVRSTPKTYKDKRTGRMAYRLEVVVAVGEHRLALTFFDRQQRTAQWRAGRFPVGAVGLFAGQLSRFRDQWQLTNPDAEIFEKDQSIDEAEENARKQPDILPIYPTAAGLTSWHLEAAVRTALSVVSDFPDVLPPGLVAERGLIDAETAFHHIHRPPSEAGWEQAAERLKLDEAVTSQAVLALRHAEHEREGAVPRPGRPDGLLAQFDRQLPFELTAGQREVSAEIINELTRDQPMQRLLQGEVGSGKTVVALRAMLHVVDSGGQAVLLAPTEVLAQQHHRSITTMLGDLARAGELGGDDRGTQIALLTGSLGAKARKQALLDAISGEAGLIIGTHALLEERVQFRDLGLVVVDEQHRFGVEQRAALTMKADRPPHVLVMTATPIPRTVAMTVFGDLDTSTLSQLPAGRAEVQTVVVPVAKPAWVQRAWDRIREEVAAGHQAYVVCSRITSDPEDDEKTANLFAVEDLIEQLRTGELQGLEVDMLHGQMTPEDKEAAMGRFARGETDVLVSTTVIEVGVDVPNATTMVIMDAERFGVSQLHQLRGRIGRGRLPGLCLLITSLPPYTDAGQRLDAVAKTRDGFALSEVDLHHRGEGDVLGRDQSGAHSSLKLLSVLKDADIISDARAIARELVASDPGLANHRALAEAVRSLERTEQADFMDRS